MASVIKIEGQEQTFTTANTFSNSTSNTIAGWNVIRIINTGTAAAVVTVNNNPQSNLTIMPSGEIIIKKNANTTIQASNNTLLAVSVAYENN